MTKPSLTVWVVYFNPRDYPGKFVLRGQDVFPGQDEPVPQTGCLVRDTIEDIRQPLEERGLYREPRQPQDDPAIVEVWY